MTRCGTRLERLWQRPNDQKVSIGSLPVPAARRLTPISFEECALGSATTRSAPLIEGDAHYFGALALPMLKGRGFTAEDASAAPMAAVVSGHWHLSVGRDVILSASASS